MPLALTPLRKVELALLIFFSAWLALVVVAPFTLPAGSVTDLSGSVNHLDNQDQIAGMNPLAAAVYWIGDLNCHQLASRSFFLNGNEMPFCARDLGLFIGLVVGMAVALLTKVRPPVYLLALGVVPLGVDGLLQLLTEYESSNPVRLLTGILAGACLALMIHKLALVVSESRTGGSGKPEHASK